MNEDLKQFYEQEKLRFADEKRHNDRLLRVIEAIKGKAFVKSINECLTDGCFVWGKLQIVNHASGHKQTDGYGQIKHYYVDQNGGGYTGDDYAGFIYIPIKKGKYLKAEYTC